ncbi:hypothetical protein PAXRUDRAFT_426097 [Paxillus rubicundulus Ve08.2h10]|uniref:C2H2-type domain-containing protein n=1 Tax=Paxillus rubicundulus Ve08.2h10 TaxID=930991 RepID=A0A0D0DXI0_9AGAM|nr:hypothetical protein PAXRUDRAFT_426097 [Paxillus rubicundulus Ve08.2h10]
MKSVLYFSSSMSDQFSYYTQRDDMTQIPPLPPFSISDDPNDHFQLPAHQWPQESSTQRLSRSQGHLTVNTWPPRAQSDVIPRALTYPTTFRTSHQDTRNHLTFHSGDSRNFVHSPPLIPANHFDAVVMPPFNNVLPHSGHYGPSLDFAHGGSTPEHTHSNPVIASGLPVPRSVSYMWDHPLSHPEVGFQRSPMVHPSPQLNQCFPEVDYVDNSNSHFYSSPPSSGDDGQPASPAEMWNGTPYQPNAPFMQSQPLVFTVPLSVVEFPSHPGSDDHFFQCLWNQCGTWITADKDALKWHFQHRHGVSLNNTSAVTSCGWSGCAMPLQMGSLHRHIEGHLRLQWKCSVCEKPYTRPDSVINHVRRHQDPCQAARAASIPSVMAYRAEINEGGLVTLSKVRQI